MPILGLIARVLARIALLGALQALRRRAGGAPPPWRTPGPGPTRQPPPAPASPADAERARRVVRLVAESARIGVRVVLLTGFLGAFAVLLTAGTTATTLGPRWLGIVLLVLAAAALVLALRELRAAWRLRVAQVRRRRAERLTTPDVR
ncbi:MAG: hypothetical protein JWM18_2239 [Chloroflexi bacterium]|nr:hypothetical protein [Chloroflexota bacterium]